MREWLHAFTSRSPRACPCSIKSHDSLAGNSNYITTNIDMLNWNLGVVFGSRELKHFHIFCYLEKWELLQAKLLHFLWAVLLLNVKNFELLQFLELLNRKNRQLIDVNQRISKLFGICVLQMNRNFFFQKCSWQIYFEFNAFFFHDHVTNCCHRLLTTSCTKIDCFK